MVAMFTLEPVVLVGIDMVVDVREALVGWEQSYARLRLLPLMVSSLRSRRVYSVSRPLCNVFWVCNVRSCLCLRNHNQCRFSMILVVTNPSSRDVVTFLSSGTAYTYTTDLP